MLLSLKAVSFDFYALSTSLPHNLLAIRFNLDPFDEHSDQECWDVLRRCHLAAPIHEDDGNNNNGQGESQEEQAQPEGTKQKMKRRKPVFDSLDAPIAVNGGTLSAGQKQLVALARAMLRRSQIVLTDEATSAIDLELDNQVSDSFHFIS
jgi:ABC-type multidrug transport system fused ATPase/permease subunit